MLSLVLMARFWSVFFVIGLLVIGIDLKAQDPNQPENCCFTCECYYCGAVAECGPPFGTEVDCEYGGAENCGTTASGAPVGTPLCSSWTENNLTLNPNGEGNGCVPIDGGLVVLIAGGLGMAFVSLRRRQSLELMTCAA